MNRLTQLWKRQEIARVFNDPSFVKNFENMQQDIVNLFPQSGTVDDDETIIQSGPSNITADLLANTSYVVDIILTFTTDNASSGLIITFTLPSGEYSGYQDNNTLFTTSNNSVVGKYIIRTGSTSGTATLNLEPQVLGSNMALKAGLCSVTFTQI